MCIVPWTTVLEKVVHDCTVQYCTMYSRGKIRVLYSVTERLSSELSRAASSRLSKHLPMVV